MRWKCLTVLIFLARPGLSQQVDPDSSSSIELRPATVERARTDVSRLDAVDGTYIFSGRKNEVIGLADRDAALTEKYGRQLFAKVPGVFVYDMDGTGNQMNIATRGLDPHRGWEFNIRKDGVLTNTDMYGYPASHYSPPMEAVERIELVRGTGSLQYGAQFGGMLNYVTKGPDTTRVFTFESINTVGSFNLLSTFNRASGRWRKWTYNVWMQRRGTDGYRANSRSDYQAQNISIGFAPSKRFQLLAEWTRSDYVIQLAGPLNDSMFHADPRSSTRGRNYYEPDIHVPSLTLRWRPDERTHVQWTSSAVLGVRSSVLFDQVSTIPDAIDSTTLQYAPRKVDIDDYHSYTSELRVRRDYRTGRTTSNWVVGGQLMSNDMRRRQLGKGTTGKDYDLTLTEPGWGRDLHYITQNVALFAENRWAITQALSVNVGARLESGKSDLKGSINYYAEEELPTTIEHHFPLFGMSAEYAVGGSINAYGGWSQAYRPVLLKDIVPASTFETVDKNLKDAFGNNAELGIRGSWRALRWDVSAFRMAYDHRMGTLTEQDTAGNVLIRHTNIGNSLAKGVECFVQADLRIRPNLWLSIFTSTAYLDARYTDAKVRSGNTNVDISGNNVESAPAWTSRNGITLHHGGLRFSVLYSYVSKTYADAMNTEVPNASGTVGLVPAYAVLDMNATITVNRHLELRANLNNALDEHYFTKRPQFYPGPGVWSSDGRGWSVSAALRL